MTLHADASLPLTAPVSPCSYMVYVVYITCNQVSIHHDRQLYLSVCTTVPRAHGVLQTNRENDKNHSVALG